MSPLEKAKNEMTMYLQYPKLDIVDCPLGWWKKEAVHLPMLSTLAKKFCGFVPPVYLLKESLALVEILSQVNKTL